MAPPGTTRYVIGPPVLTSTGTYAYREVPLREARRWLDRGPYVSRIGHEALAEAMQILLGERPAIEQVEHWAFLRPGDEALAFHFRAGTDLAKLDVTDISPEFVKKRSRVGLLRRLR